MILPVPIAASKAEDGGASSFTALKDGLSTSTCSKDQGDISIDASKEDVVISSTSFGFLKDDIASSTSIADSKEEDGGAYIVSSMNDDDIFTTSKEDVRISASSKDQGRISIAPIDAISVDAWKDDGVIFSTSVGASKDSSDFSTGSKDEGRISTFSDASKDDGGYFTHLTSDGSMCIDPVAALKDDGGNISIVSAAASKADDGTSTPPISGSICIFTVAALKDDGGISIAPVAASEADANISIAPLAASKADDAKFTVPCIVPVVADISTVPVTPSKADDDGNFFTSPVAASMAEDGGGISMEDDGILLSPLISHGISMEALISEIGDMSLDSHHSNTLYWNEDFISGDNDYLDSSDTPPECFTFLCIEVDDSSSASGSAQTGGGNAAEAPAPAGAGLDLAGGGNAAEAPVPQLDLAARVHIRGNYISAFRHLEMGNYTEASRIVNNLVEEHPNQALAYVAEANIQYWIACLCCVHDIFSLNAAETSARRAMALSPQSTYVKWLLASILLDLGYCTLSLADQDISSEYYDDAAALCLEALDIENPTDPELDMVTTVTQGQSRTQRLEKIRSDLQEVVLTTQGVNQFSPHWGRMLEHICRSIRPRSRARQAMTEKKARVRPDYGKPF